MKNVLFTLLFALTACSSYHAVRPPASAYARPVRPQRWTTGVNSIEELRRYSASPPARPPGWTTYVPPPNAPFATPPVQPVLVGGSPNYGSAYRMLQQMDAEKEAREAHQQQIDALNGIRDEISKGNIGSPISCANGLVIYSLLSFRRAANSYFRHPTLS
jgi:hypothetical protein